ncbi:angiogenic factor with G patch and FHA domains 1 isoform X4 [Pieris napi]|uniref:angiogenic factor with G patch and FHA domains 1 isoform X4 n=1 Tax=Pieris napi TaxID=78633 RepID=UPI001FBBEE7B|nr:angiogenic factor with G patch and FHA domains 1 isoform X4 [Pieris napi]
MMEAHNETNLKVKARKCKPILTERKLRLSLKYRPKILKLILKLRLCLTKKNHIIKKLTQRLHKKYHEASTQTDIWDTSKESANHKSEEAMPKQLNVNKEQNNLAWSINDNNEKTIADQVKEVAQSAMQESGMVYVESAGMYYDYKTGYYYNSELGLYYHTDTSCYYYYSEEKKSFVFHSYPDRSAENPNQIAHERKKSKQKRVANNDDIENLTKNLSKVSLRGTALETVAKHHPPCMRVIVRETTLPKLKVGSLFLVTKDGGTIGREGEHHSIVLRDQNVSREHLHIKYDLDRRTYFAMDLGSKNGTVLNGVRMSPSQETSSPIEIVHGSTLQLGETKLLCHIHPGTDTCGHCEPGLIMEMQDKEKKAYTRTCGVKKQHELELARLKNKYAPKLLEIDQISYKDRAQMRREKVGSSHHAEKTQTSDINTCITPENKGFKLLQKMGWSKGEGLGKDNQGDQDPIPLVGNEGKTGLGATPTPEPLGTLGPATMRLAAKTKMLQPPAKAFQNEPEDEFE